jgi:hypothetical protein
MGHCKLPLNGKPVSVSPTNISSDWIMWPGFLIAETLPGADATEPLLTNDAVIFGILMVMLAAVFATSSSQNRYLKSFYKIFPMLLLCYFLPSLLTFFNVVDPNKSKLYTMASRYLLPASLVLLTISIDLKEIFKLGPKALIMFLAGTFGVVFGGPIAVLIASFIQPELIGGSGPDAVWRGIVDRRRKLDWRRGQSGRNERDFPAIRFAVQCHGGG